MEILYTLLTLCLFGGTTALYPECITIEAQKNFDIQKFTGKWFIWGISVTGLKPLESACGRVNFNREYNGQLKRFESVAQEPDRTIVPTTKTGYISHLDEPSRFRMKDDQSVEYDEVVFATDYDSYAFVHICPDSKKSFERMIMIYTREEKPSDVTLTKMSPIITTSNTWEWNLMEMNHTDCDHVYWGHFGWTQGKEN